MFRSVTVIIPALDEEREIARSVTSAWASGANEVIVSDGGSRDRTRELARDAGARVLETGPPRGGQLNAAAREASHEILVFLHADSTLPSGAARDVSMALDRGYVFGGFRIRFRERSWKLRLAEAMINLRSRLTGAPWGDQAQFIERERFERVGGFLHDPIMEDYDLARRMRQHGKTIILDSVVVTSGRRFREHGLLRTAVINWKIIWSWHRGRDPRRLAAIYRGTDRD